VRPRKVDVSRVLILDGEEVDCLVRCEVQPGVGTISEPNRGAYVDEIVSVRTDEKTPRAVPAEKWPEGLLEEVELAAVQQAAEEDAEDHEDIETPWNRERFS
jgi:hypothetical protein